MIRIRALRVVGASKNYDVSFLLPGSDQVRALSVIAGEITTGKSSVLDFIDYCFGAAHHPDQIEVQRQGRAALVELEIGGRILTIERALFNNDQSVLVHDCRIGSLGEAHPARRTPLGPAKDTKSLNWLLLTASSLEGVVLKEAPTKQVTATDYLSFRDVMDLAYLDEARLNAGQLLHEQRHMKQLKLQQLIEVVFGVHDQELATLGDRIKLLEDERLLQRREIDALVLFLEEQDTPGRLELAAARERASRQRRTLVSRLRALEKDMAAETASAEAIRQIYGERQAETRQASALVRDREALLTRLLPLRGQYAEDERKLVFFAEATQVFDPLDVTTCPSCLQLLEAKPGIVDGRCTLCDQPLISSEEQQIDVNAERRAINARLRAIDKYIAEVESESREGARQLDEARQREAEARFELDNDLGVRLAPFVADRDRLARSIEANRAAIREIDKQIGYRDGVDRRTAELEILETRLSELKEQQRLLEAVQPQKSLVLSEISARFANLLKTFGFPKLDDPEPPYLDEHFHPHVRGVRYERLRSTGATTLVAVAWQLTMFEAAVEAGRPHPGFLLLDSPQTGLKPSTSQEIDSDIDDDAAARAIAEKVWIHIRAWAKDHRDDAQLIVVDNLPPAFVEPNIVARYSGDASDPPYGFIDNEVG